jgi:hypothetical protein
MTCSVAECQKPALCKGLCNAHYLRDRRHGNPLIGGPLRMPPKMGCTVSGCSERAAGRGLCSSHYQRLMRHGDLTLRKIQNGTAVAFLIAARDYQDDACLIWPYGASNGYGSVVWDGRTRKASRVICEQIHGPPPKASLQAAHSCGERRCINWRHLRWATRSENEADKVLHGRTKRGKSAKLTAPDVLAIRASDAREEMLAAQFGVAATTIRAVRNRKNWKWL